MKLSRVINYDKAIYDFHGTGFDFGFNSLFMYKDQLYANNDNNNYENNLNTKEIYDIEEIETFIVIKKKVIRENRLIFTIRQNNITRFIKYQSKSGLGSLFVKFNNLWSRI
ncbi:unnamed protein product [Rhizophagus irregularis]|nr:unnamed protein product [Rhizophagus irregularis]